VRKRDVERRDGLGRHAQQLRGRGDEWKYISRQFGLEVRRVRDAEEVEELFVLLHADPARRIMINANIDSRE
jgi:hypothetical protein